MLPGLMSALSPESRHRSAPRQCPLCANNQFAAWLGLTPLQKSSGGKERLGRITKMGDKYLRKLLIVGMTSLVRRAKDNPPTIDPRLANLLVRKPVRVATVAMANKTARIIWAIMTRGETLSCQPPAGPGRITATIHA
jgi:transposase IS116/IS110/IS902 family protein